MPFSTQLWLISSWGYCLQTVADFSIEQWTESLLHLDVNICPFPNRIEDFVTFSLVAIDLIWKIRNQARHKGIITDVWVAARIADSLAAQYRCVQALKLANVHDLANIMWKPPSKNWIKVNCDAAFKDGRAFGAFIVRNHDGNIIFAFASPLSVHDAKLVEVEILVLALSKFLMLNWKTSDISWASRFQIEMDRDLVHRWHRWQIKKIPRVANRVAHNLAKWAFDLMWDGPIPPNSFPFSCCNLEPFNHYFK
ncbi:hypothetical protein CDL12_21050 [Handroanthus impetiginosus]|uniref:RNase H type-1 domain-containing protein n=1 Tax=Handroanthus impetiginosus TaxID=429701 RepID=A0A2G9GM70_9LAMI|nr:hypothetical protein CDL12_21050 [Handroanthus impetiginosus]